MSDLFIRCGLYPSFSSGTNSRTRPPITRKTGNYWSSGFISTGPWNFVHGLSVVYPRHSPQTHGCSECGLWEGCEFLASNNSSQVNSFVFCQAGYFNSSTPASVARKRYSFMQSQHLYSIFVRELQIYCNWIDRTIRDWGEVVMDACWNFKYYERDSASTSPILLWAAVRLNHFDSNATFTDRQIESTTRIQFPATPSEYCLIDLRSRYSTQ
jgi:hypothetical protein